MIEELIRAFLLIFVAEMGDKTQILAMTFATQYKVHKVLLGVLIGSALNHGIAIALGAYLSSFIPINTVQLIAGILFIGFGLWTLKPDGGEEEEGSAKGFGSIVTVALAFFIGELGDKTQLAAMTLATDAEYPLFILMGTVLGMIVTSGVGIFVGSKLGEKIPDLAIKLGSAAVFILFGVIKLFQTIPARFITSTNVIVLFAFLGGVIYILLRPILKARRAGRSTSLKEVATTLYIHTNKIKKAIEDICLGEKTCGTCQGGQCLIGYTKGILKSANEKGNYIVDSKWSAIPQESIKNFDESKITEALAMILAYYLSYGIEEDRSHVVNRTRENLEVIAFGSTVSIDGGLKRYLQELKKKNQKMANKIIDRARMLEKVTY